MRSVFLNLFKSNPTKMTAQIIDGKQIAADLKLEIAQEVAEIKAKYNIIPTLCAK